MVIMPPMMVRILGDSFSQNQAMMMTNKGSTYNILVTELAFPNESAIAQVT